jgi:hypothetical protein
MRKSEVFVTDSMEYDIIFQYKNSCTNLSLYNLL